MIYRVVLDDTIDIHTSNIDCMLLNPSIELEMNSAGSFTFTLPPTHPNWDDIKVLKSTIDVYENDELIFTGRIASIEKNWNNERVVTCEGALAYFNDSVHRQMKWETPLPIAIDPDDQSEDPAEHRQNFLEDILNNHNVFEGDNTNRYIYMGHIYVDPELVTREVDYDTTLDILTRMCIDTNGGYFQIRKDPEDGKLYLDWLKDFTDESSQPASFGLNLLNFNTSLSAEDICTGVLARGATVNDQVVTLNDVELVDKDTYPDMSVDHYTDRDQDILWHREGVATFGQVVQVKEFSDAQTAWKDQHGQVVASSLFEVARKWLEEKNTKVETIEVEVAELAWLGDGYPQYKLGQIVEVIDSVHMSGESQTTRRLPMYKLSCDLTSGSKKVTLGTPPKKELTQISASNADSSTLSSTSSSGSSGGSGSGEECKVHDVKVDGTSVVSNKVANISLTGKADVSTVNALAAAVATKADASAVTALSNVVAGKQDQIEFNTQEAATEVLTRLKADNKVYNLGGGTEVVANPSETATDDLETIKIGDTVYDISGGSTNYGKFKCDVLFVNDPLPSPTSGIGNVERTYTLGKSIDDYDAVYVVSRCYYTSGSGSTNIVSRIILKNEYYSTGFDGWGNWDGTSNNSTNRSITYTFTDDTHIKSLGCRSESGQEPVLYKIYGLKFENKLINRSDIYSEEERLIGRWTDGKPLYQKTFLGKMHQRPSDWVEFGSVGCSVDKWCYQEAGITYNDVSLLNEPYVSVRCDPGSDKVYYYCSQMGNVDRLVDGFITVRYTKTTDTPDSGVLPEDPMIISDSMIYSEEEQVVGSWTDGKPLYQKTIKWDSVPAGRNDNLAHNIPNVDHIHITEWLFANHVVGHETADQTYWAQIFFVNHTYVGYRFGPGWGSNLPLQITFQYTKTTDSILSGPKKGKIVQRSDIYSEEERMIGRWTDGKPLYQKTIIISSVSYNTSWHEVAHNISDIDNVESIEGVVIDSNGAAYYPGNTYIPGHTLGILIGATKTAIEYMNNWLESASKLIVTIQYTKTTDAPFSKQLIEDPQFVMMSDVYSEEERVVGRWTDGKPLYQRTVLYNFTSNVNNWTLFDDSISYDKILGDKMIFIAPNSSQDEIIIYPDVDASPRFCVKNDHKLYYYLTNAPKTGSVTLQYTKATDTPGTGPTPGNLVYLPALYSEEEREVGVWTDGKPLYQKTFKPTSALTNGSWNSNILGTSGSGISIKNVDGLFYGSSYPELKIPLSYYRGSLEFSAVSTNNAGDDINLLPKVDGVGTLYIKDATIQYTKTTDQPGSGKYLPDGQYAHHYSTSEKVVGTWIDGSTIYERTWSGLSYQISSTSWTNFVTVPNGKHLIKANFYGEFGTDLYEITAEESHIDSTTGILESWFRLSATRTVKVITLQYTKST